MAIQGTQVPMYTGTNVHKTHTIFVFFWFKKKNLYEKQNKAKLKNNQTKHKN